MLLVVTGGGTGGHVYPALEVARHARDNGFDLLYLGSLRGQEGAVCEREGILFEGFGSQPLYSMRTPRGWEALIALFKAMGQAKVALRAAKPNFVFSTGGYSAAPVMAAASSLKIPFGIHESNSVPGRSNLMFGKSASFFSTVFHSTEKHAPGVRCTRTGQPIRRELREAVSTRKPEKATVLVVGGSQGSEFLNERVPDAIRAGAKARVIHAAGPKNLEATQARAQGLPNYEVHPYLQAGEMRKAYEEATLVIGRSGGTLAELAMFGIPSVLVPLPTSAGQHQLHNANEFVEMNAATLLQQPEATPAALSSAITEWLADSGRRSQAAKKLREWDVPNATERIFEMISKGARA